MKLDYGAGSQPKEGFLTADFVGTPNYDFYIKDYRVIGAKDHSFNVIHCRNVLHHIAERDLPILFAEFKRLLKPDGTLIISEPREEFHEQNKLLDLLWYRFLTVDRNILIPTEYVDYKVYLTDFTVMETRNEFNNEILTYAVGQVLNVAV